MAEEQPSLTPAPAPAEAEADVGVAAGCVNLQILSPSVGVNTLAFPGLETSTTVTQLKEKIREILPLRPAGDQQRLIHRGRLLARDTETLLEVFGEEAVSSHRPNPELQNSKPYTNYPTNATASYWRTTDSPLGCERPRRPRQPDQYPLASNTSSRPEPCAGKRSAAD